MTDEKDNFEEMPTWLKRAVQLSDDTNIDWHLKSYTVGESHMAAALLLARCHLQLHPQDDEAAWEDLEQSMRLAIAFVKLVKDGQETQFDVQLPNIFGGTQRGDA